jgi:hypothetical protein
MISAKRTGLLEVRAMKATYLRIVAIAQLFIIGFSGVVSASEEPAFDRRTPIVKVYGQVQQRYTARLTAQSKKSGKFLF